MQVAVQLFEKYTKTVPVEEMEVIFCGS